LDGSSSSSSRGLFWLLLLDVVRSELPPAWEKLKDDDVSPLAACVDEASWDAHDSNKALTAASVFDMVAWGKWLKACWASSMMSSRTTRRSQCLMRVSIFFPHHSNSPASESCSVESPSRESTEQVSELEFESSL